MYKPKMGPRKGQAPAITVPSTITQMTYLNIPLVQYLRAREIDLLDLTVDTENKEIRIKQAKEGEKGYRVVATGLRGYGISPRLRKLLPAGRYILNDKRRMVFARAV